MGHGAVFLGTPQEAVPSLMALVALMDIELVVTRPDRGRGRSRKIQSPPVKTAADDLGLPVVQPASKAELAHALVGKSLSVGVVVAFGMILRQEVLEIPNAGFVNVHFSLLPRWRGAAPVERAIMAGDTQTGVTLMSVDEGLDTGPILAQRRTSIAATETGGELRSRLSELGADLLGESLEDWVDGRLAAEAQPDTGVTYASRLEPADRLLGPHLTVEQFVNHTRALAPDPGARLNLGAGHAKVLAARPLSLRVPPGEWRDVNGAPTLGVADGTVEIVTIQPAGKRPMEGAAWLRGRTLPG